MDEYRLPRTVIPSRYEITLAPDLDQVSFSGSEIVDVVVVEPTSEVVLNSVELTIDGVEAVGATGERLPGIPTSAPEQERVTLHFERTLEPGNWKLHLDFDGTLNDQLHGFYRSVYTVDGRPKTIATTQFEATDARRAFPCWDEPDLKATFDVSLIVAEGLLAVSNGRRIGSTRLDDGRVRHRFAETMKMSTYLVAFVVGELEVTETVDVAGTALRVVHPPGKGDLAGYALEVGDFALRYLTDYYGIPYPGDKLDLIAIPDFAWGAMENLGAVTFRETALLVDPDRATQSELQRVADVIAHELAHMWFGDLVTMKWWNGIWLNEAFATFMELKCVDAFRPDWKRWLSFAGERANAMEVDGLAATRPVEFPVESPEAANEMFDALTYGKGSAVLRMLEQYLGADVFRRGIGDYLRAHAYGNTETADLWAALASASGEPIAEIMDGWILQGGYPELAVGHRDGRAHIRQHQFRYLGGGDGRWQVPARYSVGGVRRSVLLGAAADLDAGPDLVVNAGGDGYYRVRYDARILDELGRHWPELAPPERYSIMADTWAAVLAGTGAAADFISLLARLPDEPEAAVWGVAVGGISELNRVISADDRPRLQQLVRDLTGPVAERLGWEPGAGETDLVKMLRGRVLRARGILGDDGATQVTARRRFRQSLADPGAVDADVGDAAIAIIAANGDTVDFDRFVELFEEADRPQDVVRYLRAAAAVPDPGTAKRLIAMILDGRVRSQDAYWVVARLLGHRRIGAAVWPMVKDRWDELLGVLPAQSKRRILDLIMYRSEPEVAADIKRWLRAHPIPGGDKYTEQQLEKLEVRLRMRAREEHRLGDSLPELADDV